MKKERSLLRMVHGTIFYKGGTEVIKKSFLIDGQNVW